MKAVGSGHLSPVSSSPADIPFRVRDPLTRRAIPAPEGCDGIKPGVHPASAGETPGPPPPRTAKPLKGATENTRSNHTTPPSPVPRVWNLAHGIPGVPPARAGSTPGFIPSRLRRWRPAACASAALIASSFLLSLGDTSAITLDAALTRALEKNPEILGARDHLEQAAGRRIILRATAFPDARVLIPGGVQGGKRAGEKSVQPFAFARGLFSQPLFDLAIPASLRRGNLEVLIAQQRLNVAVIEQLHTARIAYYTAAYHDSLLTLGEAQRQRLDTNARAQSDRYEAGRADLQAVTAARILEQEVKPRVEESRRAASGALLLLARTMGDDLGPKAQLPSVENDLSFATLDLDANAETTTALARRADLKLARLLVRAAREDQRIIEAAYFPAVNFNISGDYIPVSDVRRGSEGSARRSDDIVSSEARIGLAYTWRVVDNGKTSGAVAQRRAAHEINQLVLAKMEADVPRQLAQVQNNLRSIAARQTALSRATVVAEQTVNDVVANLSEGRSSQLEYRSAEASFLQSKAGLLAVAYQQSLARAELDRITGRYFQFEEP